jgi:hypothetical protein
VRDESTASIIKPRQIWEGSIENGALAQRHQNKKTKRGPRRQHLGSYSFSKDSLPGFAQR